MPRQALRIPFEVTSVSERNEHFREFILMNHRLDLRHAYGSIECQLKDEECLLHPGSSVASCNAKDGDPDIHFGIAGAPCDPYSTQRSKRFSDGSVASHPDFGVLNKSMLDWWKKFEPKTGIVEQVEGFNRPTSTKDPVTPMQRQGATRHDKTLHIFKSWLLWTLEHVVLNSRL